MSSQDVEYLRKANDGTPEYGEIVLNSFRKLQYRVSVYADPPKRGSGIRLAVYQAQGDCGDGAVEKNMQRLEEAVHHAKKFDAQLLSFPELYLPGYTLDPESGRAVAETKGAARIKHARDVAKENGMRLWYRSRRYRTARRGRPAYTTASLSSMRRASCWTATTRPISTHSRNVTTGISGRATTRFTASTAFPWAS